MTSIIKADNISTVSGSGNISVASGTTLYAPGHVIQVVSAITDTRNTHNNVGGVYSANIPGVEVTITPKSTTSKILIMSTIFAGCNNNNYPGLWDTRLMRGTTVIEDKFMRHHASASADNSSAGGSASNTFLDLPSTTSAITYGVQITQRISSGNVNVYVNGTQVNGAEGSSSIVAMEIAQ